MIFYLFLFIGIFAVFAFLTGTFLCCVSPEKVWLRVCLVWIVIVLLVGGTFVVTRGATRATMETTFYSNHRRSLGMAFDSMHADSLNNEWGRVARKVKVLSNSFRSVSFFGEDDGQSFQKLMNELY